MNPLKHTALSLDGISSGILEPHLVQALHLQSTISVISINHSKNLSTLNRYIYIYTYIPLRGGTIDEIVAMKPGFLIVFQSV